MSSLYLYLFVFPNQRTLLGIHFYPKRAMYEFPTKRDKPMYRHKLKKEDRKSALDIYRLRKPLQNYQMSHLIVKQNAPYD